MAKAKYTKQKNGYFQARVWDGSYVDGKKHYITIRSKKSSKDLEAKVTAYNDKIKNLETVREIPHWEEKRALQDIKTPGKWTLGL